MIDSRQKRTIQREDPSADQQREQEARRPRNVWPADGPDDPVRAERDGRRGMGSLLMAQPVRWAGVVAGFRHTNPDAFGKFALWPGRRARTGTRALRSFHFFSL